MARIKSQMKPKLPTPNFWKGWKRPCPSTSILSDAAHLMTIDFQLPLWQLPCLQPVIAAHGMVPLGGQTQVKMVNQQLDKFKCYTVMQMITWPDDGPSSSVPTLGHHRTNVVLLPTLANGYPKYKWTLGRRLKSTLAQPSCWRNVIWAVTCF